MCARKNTENMIISLLLYMLTLIEHVEVFRNKLGQYHGCWCPGSLRRQAINSHGIDFEG